MNDTQPKKPTLREDLASCGYDGKVYIHPDIFGNFAYEITSLYAEGNGHEIPINAIIQRYNKETGSPFSSPRGDLFNLTMCLTDVRADDDLVKRIRAHSRK